MGDFANLSAEAATLDAKEFISGCDQNLRIISEKFSRNSTVVIIKERQATYATRTLFWVFSGTNNKK
tara:strand:+ start:267 stop:467 length:201 start_codon:yes stop_codon:yes gene_type:complete